MRYTLAVIAAIAYAALVISLQTDIYQPLPPLPFAVFVVLALVSTIAVGMAARTWWVLLAAAAPLLWASQGPLGLIFGGFAVPPVALGIGMGVTMGRHFGRRGALAGCALLALAFLPLATAVALARWPHDRQPAHPVPIDLAMGSYAGVTLGDSEQETLSKTKEPLVGRGVRQLWKNGGEQSDPFAYSSANDALIYRDHALLLLDGTVVAIVITNPDAETADGIGPGDGLALVPQRYPTLHCEAHDGYSDEGPAGPPDCHGHVGDVGLWTSGDPVELVTIASVDAGMGLGLPR
jgi:hypothetical protein